MKLSSILTIMDKPEDRQLALAQSATLQRQSGASVDLIAFRYNQLYDHGHVLDAKQRRTMRREVARDADGWRQALIEKSALDPDITRGRTIWSKDIAGWVADELEKHPVDLVVKSMRPSTEFLHKPTDWYLLRSCPAPVLLLSPRRSKTSGRIIAALDFSKTNAKYRRLNNTVLRAAARMAQLRGGTVHCVYALEISPVLRDFDILDKSVNKKSMLAKIMPDVERTLAPFGIPKSRIDFPVANVGDAIQAKAHKLNADMVVVGSTAHPMRQRLGLGSSAERIIAKSRRDVLVVRP